MMGCLRTIAFGLGLALAAVTTAAASNIVTGTVARVDRDRRIVELRDGTLWRITSNSLVHAHGQFGVRDPIFT
jgi:hypothetical protein